MFNCLHHKVSKKMSFSVDIDKLWALDKEFHLPGIQFISSTLIHATPDSRILDMDMISDGRAIYACSRNIFIQTPNKQKWILLYKAGGRKAVISLSHHDGDIYFIETTNVLGQSDHHVRCIKKILDTDMDGQPKVDDLFTFENFEDEDGDYHPPSISVLGDTCLVATNDKIVSYNLNTNTKQTQICRSHDTLSDAVVLSADRFWTRADDDLVMFWSKKQAKQVVIENLLVCRLSHWKDDKLLVFTWPSADKPVQFVILNSSGLLVKLFAIVSCYVVGNG